MVHSQINKLQEGMVDLENPWTEEIWRTVRKCTMTDRARVNSLVNAVQYTVENNIPGDFVECGVWQGGSIMAMIMTLQKMGEKRKIWLYDTFEGMSDATEEDTHNNKHADVLMEKNPVVKCIAPLDLVKKNINKLKYEGDLIYVKGKVEDTIPDHMPEKIGLLRLDTDWYESTKHEMYNLWPILEEDAVMIVDDYNWWDGSTKAINEYFSEEPKTLTRISVCGVLTIK